MAAVPVDLTHWLVAVSPIVLLLVLLVLFRWSAMAAAGVAMFLAAATALTFFQMPLEALAVASGKGVWDAVFVLYVVWAAVLIYLIADRSGALYALRKGIEEYSSNDLFLVLTFGWVFVSFLQGITGFGTPVAVVAPLLLALGVRPVYAVAIPLIGHAWANNFGTLAVAWFGTQIVVDLSAPVATAAQTALLLWIPTLIGGFSIAWLYGRMPGVRHAWPLVGVISTIHGAGQLLVAIYSPFLAAFIPATVALLALYPLSRWERYRTQHATLDERPAMTETATDGRAAADGGRPIADGGQIAGEDIEREPDPIMSFGESLFPYVILTVTALLVAFPPVESFLEQFQVGFSFPAVETGYIALPPLDPYSPFAVFTHPGSVVLVGVIAGWTLYRNKGYYSDWRALSQRSPHLEEKPNIAKGVFLNGVPASLSIILLVIMSRILLDSGQIQVLAQGISAVLPPVVFLLFSNLIGLLGAFITGSNTSSNILFASLQAEAATELGLPESTILGSQMAGAAYGNAISPSNVVLGTGTVGIVGREGDVLRITITWALIVGILVGIGTWVLGSVSAMGGLL